MPVHTLVRGRFVMRDRTLVGAGARLGRSVHAEQRMPPPRPLHLDHTMKAIVRAPESAS